MAYRDLREFLAKLEINGDLHRVGVEVDPLLEMAEITDRMSKLPDGGKGLFFEKVTGSGFPAVTNIFGSPRRVCTALQVDNLDSLADRVTDLLISAGAGNGTNAAAALNASAAFSRFKPVEVSSGPCREIVESHPDLTRYPVPRNWPGDTAFARSGGFLTLPLVVTCDIETGETNCGIYLVQLLSSDTVGIRWKPGSGGGRHLERYRQRGERMPVAIVLGGDPSLFFSGMLPLPPAVDELQFAGFLRGEPVELVRCLTSGIRVPAHAELVMEGFIDPVDPAAGGEFGTHTGFYLPVGELPVMRITCITRRRKPIIPATVVGPPPMEDCHMARGSARLMLPFLQLELPEIAGLHLPVEGIFHGAALVAIDKKCSGHARSVMERLWERGWLKGSRLLVLVDRDVEVGDPGRVYWKILNNVAWQRDLVVAGATEPAGHPFGGRLGIDATRKFPGEGVEEWPGEIAMDGETRTMVSDRWKEYGFND